ncbi:hypothetical protein JMJ78_0009528, partial [Colletotrichum scovillei]
CTNNRAGCRYGVVEGTGGILQTPSYPPLSLAQLAGERPLQTTEQPKTAAPTPFICF